MFIEFVRRLISLISAKLPTEVRLLAAELRRSATHCASGAERSGGRSRKRAGRSWHRRRLLTGHHAEEFRRLAREDPRATGGRGARVATGSLAIVAQGVQRMNAARPPAVGAWRSDGCGAAFF